MRTFHCFFEQSGTFKNEFKKLGHNAYDYDILNDYNETDYVMDLYEEIERAYAGGVTVFDSIKKDELIFAFFPCVRFSRQILLAMKGTNHGMRDWSLRKKLENSMTLHAELHHNYLLISKLIIVCLDKGLPLVIENPYSTDHYLTKYLPLEPKVIDLNRRENGDSFVKPTQFYFVNCEPRDNLIFEAKTIAKEKTINWQPRNKRSLITPEYANYFIRTFLL